MAILRGLDGRFYEVPDDQATKFLIPEDKVKEKLAAAGAPVSEAAPPPPSGGGGAPPILVQIYGVGAGSGGPPPGAPGPDAGAPPGAEVSPYDWQNRSHWHNWQNWQNWHNRHRD